MTKLLQLFRFNGRTSRLGYWRVQIVLLLVAALFWCGGLFLTDITGVGVLSAIALLGCAPVCLAAIALLFRRLHDRNKSAWWIVPFQVAPFALAVTAQAQLAQDAGLAGLLALVELVLAIWGFVEVGLMRGTRGPNDYGPDPQIA